MSAIAGIFYLDGRSVDTGSIESMLASLAHRGPDGSHLWRDGSVGLGHRMLWTTPESLYETLPLISNGKRFVLTSDARIDNRDDLKKTLGIHSNDGREPADSELILAAYEKWGENCAERLLGDFAFAIWDGRVLFCARDPLGVKPFYYFRSGKAFAFASQIRGLQALKEIPFRLNEIKIADYLMAVMDDKTGTFYQDIYRLAPAHTMTIGKEGVKTRRYWALDPSREIRLTSDSAYAEKFRDIFSEAVRCRLRSSFPTGSMLSGGLDSSSITCVARNEFRRANREFHTFSAVFDDFPKSDERSFMQTVVAQGGLEAHYVRGDSLSPLTDLEKVLDDEDEPFYAPNLYLHWGLYQSARQSNVRVLLDGFDGDIVVSHGLGLLTELGWKGRWIHLAKEIKGLSRRYHRSSRQILLRHVLRPLSPEFIGNGLRFIRRRRKAQERLVHPQFFHRINLEKQSQSMHTPHPKHFKTARQYHHDALTWGLLPFALEVADRAAASFSIEARYPFFDQRLVEFCLALPSEQKIRRGWTRFVMRCAMEGILPKEVQWREGKSDLSPNFVRSLLAFREEDLGETFFDNTQCIGKYINLEILQKICHRYDEKKREDDVLDIWKALTLVLWLRRAGFNSGFD